jgi:type II secretory ATPase GspE/PulE/Tfp pilus assembly ATPase PilB-like protein
LSGYVGRKAVSEVFVVDEDLEALILESAPHHELKRYLAHKGFRSMYDDARDTVLQGATSVAEMIRIVGGA